MKVKTTIIHLIKRKIATVLLITASLAAFATLSNEGIKKNQHKNQQKSLLKTNNYSFTYKPFSLKTQFNYRGNNILNSPSGNKIMMMNTVIAYQKGNATYILPMKKKILLNKINFNTTR